MNKSSVVFVAVLAVLAGYALYAAQGAAHRGNGMAAFVMVVIAMLFWKAIQRRRQ